MAHRVRVEGGRAVSLATAVALILSITACGGGGGGGSGAPGNVGTASLSWTPPTTNSDGTALSDLAGYNIYYGTASGLYPNKVVVSNPGLSNFLVQNLANGEYFFMVRAYDLSGNESVNSNVASKTIQ